MNNINPYLALFKNWEESGKTRCNFDNNKFGRLIMQMNWIFSHAIPTDEALNEIIKYSPIVEIFAGSGYWAWLLRKRGCKIKLYDNYSYTNEKHGYSLCRYPYFWIRSKNETPKILDNDKFKKYTLFLCWLPNEDEGQESANCLEYYRGNKLIYIGQNENGVTAGKKYFNILRDNWIKIKEIKLPNWPNYDTSNLYIYNKNT